MSKNPVPGPRRALIVVDVQPTFCEGGALPVTGGNACAERIAQFVARNRHLYSLLVTTQDWHVDPGDHFSATPDYVDTWPPHGVAGTPEAELHPALSTLRADLAVKKGQYAAAYSGFEGTTDSGNTLSQELEIERIEAIDVVGLAESHCVKDTAIDAAKLGYQVRCLLDLTEPVSPELGQAARVQMQQAGVKLVQSASC